MRHVYEVTVSFSGSKTQTYDYETDKHHDEYSNPTEFIDRIKRGMKNIFEKDNIQDFIIAADNNALLGALGKFAKIVTQTKPSVPEVAAVELAEAVFMGAAKGGVKYVIEKVKYKGPKKK